MKYKNNKDVSKNVSKELVQCAKIVNKLDNKMLLLNSWKNKIRINHIFRKNLIYDLFYEF